MRVDLDQPGNHRLVRSVDQLADVATVAVRLDAPDPVTVDDNVDVGPERVGPTIPDAAGVNGRRPRRVRGRRPCQVRIELLDDLPGRDVDALEAIAALLQE